MAKSFESYSEKHPWGKGGKGSTVVGITPDNIALAQAARRARQKMQQGKADIEDVQLVEGREELIQKALEEE
jgi:hypothetical protein